MSGYTMVKKTAQQCGWAEAAEIIVPKRRTKVTFSKGGEQIEILLDTTQAGPLVQEPANSVLSADIYEGGKLIGEVRGSGKVQQIQAYLKDGTLP